MTPDPWWRRYWRSLGVGPEVAEELEFHVEQITRDLVAKGMPLDDARREAARRFGDRRRVQSQLEHIERGRGRRLRLGLWLEEVWADIRYGVRGLVRKPGFAFGAAASLALGIGAATVVFTIVDAWMFRPLPVDRPERLVLIGARDPAVGDIAFAGLGLPTVRDLAARNDLLEDVAAWRIQVVAVRPVDAERASLGFVLSTTGNYFDLLGVKAALGRVYSDADARERASVMVLDHTFWKTQLAGDPGVIGRPLLLNGVPFTVIGVADPDFRGTEHLLTVGGYFPTASEATLDPARADLETNRADGGFLAVARRRDDVSMTQLHSALAVESARLVTGYPELPRGYQLAAYDETEARPSISVANQARAGGLALLALAALILATAAVNVTNLILTRASGRQEEMAVRLALGASRWRVMRQLLTESALLGLLGFIGAWGLAHLALNGLGRLATLSTFPLRLGFVIDGRVLVASLVVALAAGMVSGVGPALVTSRQVQATLRRAGRGGLGGLGGRFRSGLVVAQVAASFLVLVAAGLFLESVRRAESIPIGIRPEHVVTGMLQGAQARLTDATAPAAFERLAADLRSRPGVEAVSLAASVPMNPGGSYFSDVFLSERPANAKPNGAVSAMSNAVDPFYFTVMGMTVRAGRTFTLADDSLAPRVAIVNEEAARLWWPGADPIGKQIRLRADGPPVEIVGVVPTGRYLVIMESPRPYIMTPLAQTPAAFGMVLVKSRLTPANAREAIRSAAASIHPDLVPFALSTMDEVIGGVNGLMPLRFGSLMTAAIGVLALILTVLGLYGVLAYSVSQQTREIGVRMALGANPAGIVRRVLFQGGRLVALGMVVGAVLAIAASRLLANLLIGGGGTSVPIYLGVGLLLVTIAGGAAYLPARRAARLDPVRALRE